MKELDRFYLNGGLSKPETALEDDSARIMIRAELLLCLITLLLPTCSLWAQEDARKEDAQCVHVAFEKAIDKHFAQGYPQQLERYFCSLGTNLELGFRWAGTTAEHATGIRVQEEMQKMGLSDVRREPVPVDAFEFKKATVVVGARVMTASAFAGVQPTPDGGITAPIVYVKGGTAADFDAAGDVFGKIVLIDNLPSSWWPSIPALEASYRRAAGIILTFTPEDTKYYSFNSRALGAFDSAYDFSASPFVYLCQQDGDWLKSQIAKGETHASMILEQTVTLAADGGVGYNVLGVLPGSIQDGQMILLLAHQDAHFRAGIDDTAGLVNMLTVAKAMCTANYRPKHTIVFMATSGEEFGGVNCYYDWLSGSWWAISHEHKEWVGQIRATVNVEAMGVNGTPLSMRSNPELKPWLVRLSESNAQYLPFGSSQETPVSSWNDQWPFTASGIPSVQFDTTGLEQNIGAYPPRYHTNYDTQDQVDWDYLAKIAKFIQAAVQELDDGLLPYSLNERAKDLAATIDRKELLAAGAESSAVSHLCEALSVFKEDACAYQRIRGSIPGNKVPSVNNRLLEIERALNGGLTALSSIDDATVYPHQQVLADAISLKSALAVLQSRGPDIPATLKALESVGETALGLKFSYAVYRKVIGRKHPSYHNLRFASLGNLPIPVDVMPEYRAIENGQLAGALVGIEAKHNEQISVLNGRLKHMTSVLREVHALMEKLL